MKTLILKIIFGLTVLFASLINCFGQEIDFEESNWFKEIIGVDDYYTRFDFNSYSKEDVVRAKKRFNLIEQSLSKTEWEGTYSYGTEVGETALHWSARGGFVIYRVYHTLSSLDYGSAFNKDDTVNLVSEKSPANKRKSYFSTNLVKIKFGDKHYLVPQKRVQDFAERAVGLNTELSDFNYYLWKRDESEYEIFGLPILPEKFKQFLRLPVETKIIKIGNRELYQDKFSDGTVNYEEIYYHIVLGAGKNKKIKPAMNFFIEDLGEWVEITKVSAKSSTGKIKRGLNKNRQEECRDSEGGQGQIVLCRKIKLGMNAKTKVSESFF